MSKKNSIVYRGFTLGEVSQVFTDALFKESSVAKYTSTERLETAEIILKDLSKNYEKNKGLIFAIIETTLTVAVPRRTEEIFSAIADIEYFKAGDRVRFKVKHNDIKAYHVALGGTVPRYRIFDESIDVITEAIQVRVYEEIARIRAGLVDFSEIMNEAMRAINDAIYEVITQTLVSATKAIPNANKASGTEVDEKELDKLIQIVESYGTPVILGTRAGLSTLPKIDSHKASDDIYDYGVVGKYKGCEVVMLNNSVVNIDNKEFVLPDKDILIIPSGREKIVKVAFEGEAMIREFEGKDWTKNFEILMQIGTAVLETHYIAVYENESLK